MLSSSAHVVIIFKGERWRGEPVPGLTNEIPSYLQLPVCRFASLQVYRFTGLQNCRYTQQAIGLAF